MMTSTDFHKDQDDNMASPYETFLRSVGAKKIGHGSFKIPVDAITANNKNNWSRDGRAHPKSAVDAMVRSILEDGQMSSGEVVVDHEAKTIELRIGFRRLAALRKINERDGAAPVLFEARVMNVNAEKSEDRNFTENANRVGLTDMQVARQLDRLRKTRNMPVKTTLDPESGEVLESGLDSWLADRGIDRQVDWINKTLRLNGLIKPLQDLLHKWQAASGEERAAKKTKSGKPLLKFARSKAQNVAKMSADEQRQFLADLKAGKKPAAKQSKTKRPSIKTRKAFAEAANDELAKINELAWIAAFMDVVNGDETDEDAYSEIPLKVRLLIQKHDMTPTFLAAEVVDDKQTTIPGAE